MFTTPGDALQFKDLLSDFMESPLIDFLLFQLVWENI